MIVGAMISLEGFDDFAFAFECVEKPVYRRGDGPAVVLIHELPGMMPDCVDLARVWSALTGFLDERLR